MNEQEKEHLDKFNELIQKHRARPTIMQPIWHFAGWALGYSTAIMGKEAAMACTAAVETEIGEHYNDQLRTLIESEIDEPELRDVIRKFRDDELSHLDTALNNNAEKVFLKLLNYYHELNN